MKKHIHLLPPIYFMVLGIFLLAGDLVYHTFQATDLIYVALLMLPITVHRQWLYATFGLFSTIVWTLFLAQVIVWFSKEPHHQMGAHHYTTTDFVIGLLLCSVSALCSAALLYQAVHWQDSRPATH